MYMYYTFLSKYCDVNVKFLGAACVEIYADTFFSLFRGWKRLRMY